MTEPTPALDFTARIEPGDVHTEDGGRSRYVDLTDDDTAERGPFVRLMSWEEHPPYDHPEFAALIGRRVRIRIEPVD